MTTYAATTSVPADRSRAEIEKTLSRYGASKFMYGWEESFAIVGFVANGRQVRFVLPLPERQDAEFTKTPTGRPRTTAAAEAAYEQSTRARWRALALVIKAKLEAVETGIVSFEQEFLPHIVLPNNQTVGEWAIPQVHDAYEHGTMPELLPSVEQIRALGPGPSA